MHHFNFASTVSTAENWAFMGDDFQDTFSETSDQTEGQGNDSGADERPMFNIDGVSYPIDSLPESIAALINDLLRFSQEQNELQYRLRLLQAAQQTYVAVIKQELDVQGVVPLNATEDMAEAA